MTFKVKVLSIDGGGIKGIVPAMILAEIEKRTETPICELFDMIAGTSTGGILALGLTKPNKDKNKAQFTAQELVDLYVTQGETIFQKRIDKKISSFQKNAIQTVLNAFGIDIDPEYLFSSRYGRSGKREVLNKWLGTTPIKDALTEILITSYATNLRMPFLFTSHLKKEQKYKKAENFRAVCEGYEMQQAALATSAAPTYFKPYPLYTPSQLEAMCMLVDGGVFANNPTSIAVIEAMKSYEMKTGDNISLDEILVVSLGTGRTNSQLNIDGIENWGQIKWIEPLINMVLNGQSEVVDYQMEQLLLTNSHISNQVRQYYRFQPRYAEIKARNYSVAKDDLVYVNDEMDNASKENIVNLVIAATKFIGTENHALDVLATQLIE